MQNQYSVGCAPLCFKIVIMLVSVKIMYVKFMFSKKATKIDEIFTVDLTVTTYCQIVADWVPRQDWAFFKSVACL